MAREKSHLVIVGLGQVVPYKYLSCISEYVGRGVLDGYSIIDLETEKESVSRRVDATGLQPENVFFCSAADSRHSFADRRHFAPIFEKLLEQKQKLKVFISPEVKAHQAYLEFCVENGIDSLTEKPIFAPMKNGQFYPTAIEGTMRHLLMKMKEKPANHSVMTLGRYHAVFNDALLDKLRQKIVELHSPLTSFHLRTASGVWNLYREYETREDHPYKYGYGMLMHGAYHYVDLMAQFLELNKIVYPSSSFDLILSSFAAYPDDQFKRISEKFNKKFDDVAPKWAKTTKSIKQIYGETDITTSFCIKDQKSGKVITVGTLSLEQTTPSIRAWKELPESFYNVNGRVSCTDIEVQLSTLFSMHARSFKVPKSAEGKVVQVDNFAQVHTRANASLLKREQYNTEQTILNFFNSASNRKLMSAWFEGKETKSQLASHFPTMKITQALALSIQNPGEPVRVKDLFEEI